MERYIAHEQTQVGQISNGYPLSQVNVPDDALKITKLQEKKMFRIIWLNDYSYNS